MDEQAERPAMAARMMAVRSMDGLPSWLGESDNTPSLRSGVTRSIGCSLYGCRPEWACKCLIMLGGNCGFLVEIIRARITPIALITLMILRNPRLRMVCTVH
ncbi:protein of unknown function [Magnetospirillum sp. XM-1]|nr:protein of unknown function [Magnetospirillum sp. XM-1]